MSIDGFWEKTTRLGAADLSALMPTLLDRAFMGDPSEQRLMKQKSGLAPTGNWLGASNAKDLER